MARDGASTRALHRLEALVAALLEGPIDSSTLYDRIGLFYGTKPSSWRKMVNRDIQSLERLGMVIHTTRTRPPRYTFHGMAPILTNEQVRVLGLIRDTFGATHPQTETIHGLLHLLTARLSEDQRALYETRQSGSAPLNPAIDYAPHRQLLQRLEQSITHRELVDFNYRNSKGEQRPHRVEPYAVEYYDRHFYLVGYKRQTHSMIDYRIDRISQCNTVQTLPPALARRRQREQVIFQYRLAAQLVQNGISQRFDDQRVITYLSNGDAIIEASGRSDFFIIQTMLRYRNLAEIISPAPLRERMVAEVSALSALYSASDHVDPKLEQ